ncbi:phage major capsid protein [Cereibacter azotoformans]|uniref:phage major capsid protein n=1 Tax=Cereibacter azotoformans TaxID=43057 RepID=UPI000E35A6D0|nr:phage major capsid protein [Cereibacter azotoformans]AXQ93198.1 phage major capsid protein [Cereibacter sphaeroides]UIJ31509.1 phage major capsid protein [Cereibacter azotoformans]
MDRITALRARRAGIIDQMEALVASVADGEDMTADQAAQFDALKAEDDKVAADLARAEDLERRRAAAARPVQPLPGVTPAAPAPAQAAEKGITFARMIRTIAAAGGNAYVAQQIAEANGDSGLFANQNMGSGVAGGFLVPEDVSAEVIELLRPASVVTAMGPRIVPMPNGNLTTNRRATGATFGYGGEQTDAPATGYTYGQVKLSAKKLRGIIPVSNDLLRSASVSVDRMIRDDAIADAALIQDRHFLRGAGTEFSPRGLRYQHLGSPFEATHVLVMTASPDLQKVTNDLARLELALATHNVVQTNAHWIMSPRTESYLSNLRDGNGNLAFPEMQNGRLRRKPVHVTTEIPENLGASGSETEIMLADPTHIMVGEHMGIEVAMSTEAAYKDASGTMQAAFSRDETLMRMIMQHDIGLRHLPAVAILTGVTWSPSA